MSDNINTLKENVESFNIQSQRIILKENEQLSRHSTFKIGGPARLFAIPSDVDSLIFLLNNARNVGVRLYVIGNGSNILFDDAGYDGLIISTSALNGIIIDGDMLTAECGAMLSACAVRAKEHALSGMECLFGIPGSVGGAVYMNAGAYGGEMKDIVFKTTYLDPTTLEIHEIQGIEHNFGYRHSIFKDNGGIILKTEMKLTPGDTTDIISAMDDYKFRRITKQPLEYPSAGSTFKRYPGRYTGQMIEESGLKGYTVGGAQVSEKHAGFVINRGNATSADVLKIIDDIRSIIRSKYGISIETEVIYVK